MQQSPGRGEVKPDALGKRYKRFRRKRVKVEPGYELVFHGHRGGLVEKVYDNGDVGFLDREGKRRRWYGPGKLGIYYRKRDASANKCRGIFMSKIRA